MADTWPLRLQFWHVKMSAEACLPMYDLHVYDHLHIGGGVVVLMDRGYTIAIADVEYSCVYGFVCAAEPCPLSY